jgi:hypothetical protein
MTTPTISPAMSDHDDRPFELQNILSRVNENALAFAELRSQKSIIFNDLVSHMKKNAPDWILDTIKHIPSSSIPNKFPGESSNLKNFMYSLLKNKDLKINCINFTKVTPLGKYASDGNKTIFDINKELAAFFQNYGVQITISSLEPHDTLILHHSKI